MKKAYKEAMSGIAVSDQMRERLLAAAARPRPRMTWVKPVCGAAACFALVCVVGLTGMEFMGRGLGLGMAKSAAPEAADYATADACAPGAAAGGEDDRGVLGYHTDEGQTGCVHGVINGGAQLTQQLRLNAIHYQMDLRDVGQL